MNIDFYNKLEKVDKKLIKINEWQERKMAKLMAATERKITKTLKQLSEEMPEEAKRVRR